MSQENQVASETVSEQPTQESPTSSPDVGALIAESKKYRARAQDAEARISEMEKKIAKAEEAKLKEKEDFKTLYNEASSKIESLSSNAEKWSKYEEARRTSLLEKHPENEREQLSRLDLETLEFVTSKITNTKPNAPEVIGRSKDIVMNKDWKDMTDSERRAFYESKAKGN
jgi:hypothetical protein|tara:strand:+ start:221 stop:733 length:513 start_codon:yes stop_codon:yes gene_type:complete